ncbi:hypothetical protein A9G47_09835 [Gilliamella sp. WF3-4]|nr:hypothetical protein A9G47_09835 [Gilliamella apicola]
MKKLIADSTNFLQDDFYIGELLHYGKVNCPNAIAVSDSKSKLSFIELDLMANTYAKTLKYSFDVKQSDVVCVVGKKSVETVAILIAIWKLGAVFCPIDIGSGIERIKLISSLVSPKIVLTENNLQNDIFDGSVIVKSYKDLLLITNNINIELIPHAYKSDDLLYIIYTSGSTGVPKGVMITANSFKNYAESHQKWLQFGIGDRIVSLTPIHFDVFLEDTIIPLANGAHVYQFDTLYSGYFLRKIIEKHQVTHIIAVSSLLAIISEDMNFVNKNKLPYLKMLMTGAEACSVALINQWKIEFQNARVINAYGPTETTIVSHCFEIKVIDKNLQTSYPIGMPLEGTNCLLFDDEGQEISEPYIPGELLIGGPQVMAGYFDDDELTKKVIKDINGIRFYHTGDVCTLDKNGNYIFIERNDLQVKLNGKRLHLGCIHSTVLNTDGIKQCALGIVKHNGISSIGCVIVGANEQKLAEIKMNLNNTIDNQIMPAVWGFLDESIITLNGKSDNKKLMNLLQNNVINGKNDFNLNGRCNDE